MESIEDSVPERASAPRTSQACRRCRTLKTRCLPSEQDGTCQRCFNAKRQCEWPEAQRRVKKLRGPSRISQVEQKIDVLVSQLADRENSKQPLAPPSAFQAITPSSACPEQSTPGSDFRSETNTLSTPPHQENRRTSNDPANSPQFLQDLAKIHEFANNPTSHPRDPTDPVSFHPSQSGQPKDEPLQSQLVDELLVSNEANALLDEYRAMAVCFPFVPVASRTTAHDLHSHKPMLLLAILTVASRKNRSLQLSLEELYRRELAQRTILEPCQTLSLLQSILVYLAWYHLFFSPKSRQLMPLVQIATGIALDLGIYNKERRFVVLPRSIKGATSNNAILADQREAERAWLGCYYISASLSGCVQKPNLIAYTEYMSECARNLKADAEFPSDEMLLPMITIRHLRDQIGEIFGSDAFKDLPISDNRMAIHFRYLEAQLEECKVPQSDEICERVLELSASVFQTELHSIGLRAPTGMNDSPMSYPNSAHINGLISCLEGAKAFFDTLLTFPASDYHLIPSAEWMRVPYVLITLTKLCVPSDHLMKAQWDVKAAQDRVRLDLYLESLCYRMQSITTFNPPSQPKPDFWMAMKMIMDMTKTWYHRRIRESKDTSTKQSSAFRLNMLQSLHQNMGQNNPFGPGQMGNVPDGSFSGDMMGSMDMGGMQMPPLDMNHLGGSGMTPFMDMELDMEQFLDIGLWASSEFPPRMFGGNAFGFG